MGIAQNLKRFRKEAGLSQPQLAKKAGVSQQLVSQLENGKNRTTKELPKLARALGKSIQDIDPTFNGIVVTPDAARDELNAIYDRLEGQPDWQEYLVEQARQLEARVRGRAVRQAPKAGDA